MLASPSNGISNSSKIRQKLLENRVEIARKRGIQRMMKTGFARFYRGKKKVGNLCTNGSTYAKITCVDIAGL